MVFAVTSRSRSCFCQHKKSPSTGLWDCHILFGRAIHLQAEDLLKRIDCPSLWKYILSGFACISPFVGTVTWKSASFYRVPPTRLNVCFSEARKS